VTFKSVFKSVPFKTVRKTIGYFFKIPVFIFLIVSLFIVVTPISGMAMTYPITQTVDQVDFYHGIKVADPYRWLENPDSPETKAWVDAQNQVTFSYLQSIPERELLQARLMELWNYEKYGMPFKRGDRYFYSKNDGLQNQNVLYKIETLTSEPFVLLDPNMLSTDGTVALSGISISDDGSKLAYGLSKSGSDWQEWRVRDVVTGKDLDDRLEWVKFSSANWTKDGAGFFYSRYDAPDEKTKLEAVNYYQKLYYHRIGTPQSEDVLIYERPDQKEWGFSGDVTEDGRYLIITVWKGSDRKNLIFYKNLSMPDSKVVELISQWEADYTVIESDNSKGELFWVKTDLEAPRGRVVAIDLSHPEKSNWKTVISQTAETLGTVGLLNNQFVAAYLKDAHSQVKVYELNGVLVRSVKLPGLGSVGGFGGKRSDTETFFSFTSFTEPNTIYRYNVITDESSVFRKPNVKYNASDYETKQVFYTSKDGTKVPMFVTYKKGLKRDGQNPTLLYAYGGFNVSLTPFFSVSNLAWLEMGGVYAIANLRGGGEYGQAWHEAGMKLKKQNVFDDFIAAAQWLISENYTSSPKLAIEGGSNGGLLVGAVMTQRPELFGAALPAVGVMDMLRFHKFTIGWAWQGEYGDVEKSEPEFKALYAYSPLHNLKSGTRYPATMVTTADHDDRVVPAHSFKFAAALQKAHKGDNPVLIRIATKAGHGAGKPTAKVIEEAADKWAFLSKVLKMAG
jgi:prolyl oligopeptidase